MDIINYRGYHLVVMPEVTEIWAGGDELVDKASSLDEAKAIVDGWQDAR